MPTPRVLISGASIAGPTTAHWLHRHGWATTVVERFDGPRGAGQNIDVRGAGREVLRRMDLEDAVRGCSTGEQGLEFVDAAGRTLAAFPAGESDTGGATAELEVLRGELSRLVVERTTGTEYLFGDRIVALDDRADGVEVTFEHGPTRTFDVVVIAEGLTSRTRDLILPDAGIDHLGLYTAYLTIPRTAADNDWWRWYTAPGGRTVNLRPDNLGTTRASVSFLSDVRGLEDLDRPDQIRLLRRHFADAGWETPRVLAALADTAFYFDTVGQMRLPTWSSGRVVLVGDAAYCASPVSGMSTSLALVGAYVLAGELAGGGDHRVAFARYEATMRPYVEQAQDLPPGTPRLAHPRSRAGVSALRAAVRVAGSPVGKRVAGLAGGLFSPPADRIELPAYPTLRTV
ncbi:FAD-dependent monooxygenase [Pseudonocardia abyssalis]|uniref:FAD-dependent monooxygenase n=1 Tax=Pseudonocardia abyssalis TaxID=2792008 RepID=A0ABS6USR6_9PSEU|nr:FAD-dependent monooxygenase [Pseudonocardia abyssalis]MBW0117215.1 FAD-dependent monooxygenase [Pseudonocardia abyssalis]MBW0135290.1 FAD-dependent monooxygenase [Pseudonocardia abyssalis]